MRQAALFADKNFLYSGDNLRVLQYRIPDEFVDLIYLDPPFKSNQDYNLLFKERSGKRAGGQIKAFEDTWQWDAGAAQAYRDAIESGPESVGRALQAFRALLGDTDMLAYLSMMAPRLVEMHRVLRNTGSIYLHCDPTASHYLKMLMDAVFDPINFRSEIVWQRTLSKSLMTTRFPNNHDVVLSYQKTDEATWNPGEVFVPYDPNNLDEKTASKYRLKDPDGRLYQLDNLINPNPDRPNLTYEFLGITKVWRWTRERMQQAFEAGLIVQTKPGRVPRLKRYLDEQRGRAIGDVWTDIPPLNSQAKERLGYPTQKPLVLLKRIIKTSTNEGDVVLDPFCGCGTTIEAAESLGRRWIGIDITQLAIDIIRDRLETTYGAEIHDTYEFIRDPESVEDASRLANDEPYQFQWWVLDRVGAQKAPHKKGADKGIDGRLYFHDDPKGRTRQILISVKGGHTGPAHVRDLRGVIEREKATMGVLVSMQEPTGQMRAEAASAGVYESKSWNQSYPRLQLLTVAQLLDGVRIDYPSAEWLFARPAAKEPVRKKPAAMGEQDWSVPESSVDSPK